jgi:hypothetical protein
VVFARNEIGTPLFRDGLDAVSKILLPDLADVTDFLHRTGQPVLLASQVNARSRYGIGTSSSTGKLVLVPFQHSHLFHAQKDLLGRIDNDPRGELHLGAVFFDLVEPAVPTTGSSGTDDGPLGLLQHPGDSRLAITKVDLGAEVFDTLERLAV